MDLDSSPKGLYMPHDDVQLRRYMDNFLYFKEDIGIKKIPITALYPVFYMVPDSSPKWAHCPLMTLFS